VQSEKWVNVRMFKAGSTFISNFLTGHCQGRWGIGEHGTDGPYDPKKLNGNRTILGSFRDPWSHYVSLWAYRRGALHSMLKTQGVYGDVFSADKFRVWLTAMLTGKAPNGMTLRASSSGKLTYRIDTKRMRKLGVGLMTFRYLKQYYPDDVEGALAAVLEGKAFADPVGVWLNASSGEDLESQVRETIDAMGDHCDAGTLPHAANPSDHAPTASYWTQDLSRCLVQHYDRWIFLKWNLTLPVPNATCAPLLAAAVAEEGLQLRERKPFSNPLRRAAEAKAKDKGGGKHKKRKSSLDKLLRKLHVKP